MTVARRKQHLADQRFLTDADVKEAVTSLLQPFDTDFFSAGTKSLRNMVREALKFG
jgi:hypothetical protein